MPQRYFSLEETAPLHLKISSTSDVAMHHHNFFELVYLLEGRATHVRNGTVSEIREGDYFILSPSDYHEYRTCPGEGFRIVNCAFLGCFIAEDLRGCTDFDGLFSHPLLGFGGRTFHNPPTSEVYHDIGEIRRLFMYMFEEYAACNPGYAEIIRGCLLIVLTTILRQATNDPKFCRNDLTHRIIAYIEANAAGTCTLADAAEALRYSPPYLSRRFRQDTGSTFSAYLQKVRIRNAGRLLINTDLSIEAIANTVGYTDMKHFHRVFLRLIQQTPRQYRITHGT